MGVANMLMRLSIIQIPAFYWSPLSSIHFHLLPLPYLPSLNAFGVWILTPTAPRLQTPSEANFWLRHCVTQCRCVDSIGEVIFVFIWVGSELTIRRQMGDDIDIDTDVSSWTCRRYANPPRRNVNSPISAQGRIKVK